MDEKLKKLEEITSHVDSPFDRALSDILIDYENKNKENEHWKNESQSIIDTMNEEYHMECKYRGEEFYVEPPITSMDYIQACHENQGSHYVEKSLNEELMALHEMQIIYSFKQIEISLKKFIILLASDTNLRTIQRWDNLKEKFKDYGIMLSAANGYTFINQLREVNNALKHSHKVTENVKKFNIKEFCDLEYFTSDSLSLYYSNVIKHKRVFLNSIAYEVGATLNLNSEKLRGFSMNRQYEKDMDDIPF